MSNFPSKKMKHNKDQLLEYLGNQKPIILQEESPNNSVEQFSEDIIIPPLNTDIRFSTHLKLHKPTKEEAEGYSHSHSHTFVMEHYREKFKQPLDEIVIIPPLNTDIKFSDKLPLTRRRVYEPVSHDHPHLGHSYDPADHHHHAEDHPHEMHTHDHPHLGHSYDPADHHHHAEDHPHEMHTHEHTHENFSWAVPTSHDSLLDVIKKSLIHEVSTQHACGSCWAVAFADTMSDCFVVSGAVGWSPNISATYLMSCIPTGNLHNMCFGGNPAAVAPYLERNAVADTSCIDYSWCSGDTEVCKSVSSARHFDAKTLATKLNDNIPKPCGCYYKDVKKYTYKLNKGSDVLYITKDIPVDVFRNTVKSHILDFGPIIGGYVVLKNFFTGNFTDPHLNGGVYLDRADYNNYKGGKLSFNDRMTREAAGLHAISIVGWGVAKNIQYDNDKFGDVPYWHCRNSWGKNWGNDGGYFKMAMYPFNKMAQFDKQVTTSLGGPIGSMILIRATKPPIISNLEQITKKYRENINKQRKNNYYMANPENVKKINRENLPDIDIDGREFNPGEIEALFAKQKGRIGNILFIVFVIFIAIGIFWWINK
jgi:hypothetical protein